MAGSDERHSPEEIGSYINRNYPEFSNSFSNSEVSTVSKFGLNYQVVFTDAGHARHIVQIDPRNVTADRERAAREKDARSSRGAQGRHRDARAATRKGKTSCF